MGKKLGHLFQFIRWGLLTGAASMLALGANVLPAAADELVDWGYDSQTRSLTVTIPPDVSPSVSVLAADQLLIALPDTQIGDVAGLTVGDGVVDNIVLEQTTPETLWVIVEFAAGTVLANTQSIVPVGEGASAGQQWEVRPAVMASSGEDVGAIANNPEINGGGAESLRTPEVNVAQADFPDLPILEPGISLSEPVSVPPIGDSAPAEFIPPPPPPPPAAVVSVPEVPEVPEEIAVIANIPPEPPFLGEETFEVPVIDETDLSEDQLEALDEAPVEEEPIAAAPEVPMPTREADEIPADSVAAVPGLQTRVDASFAEGPEPAADEFEPEELDLSAQGVTAQNTPDRWPEPIPFGVPLPR